MEISCSEHFEVLVQEKDVIIPCADDGSGVLPCKVNSSSNPESVDGISEEVGKVIRMVS